MSFGAIILLVCVSIVFLFELVSLVLTILKKRKKKAETINDNDTNKEV